MEPGEATEPQPTPPPVRPPVEWAPPPEPGPAPSDGSGTGALFLDRSWSSLEFGDAVRTGFSILRKPAFFIPVLILSVIVNVIVDVAFGSALTRPAVGTALTQADITRIMGAVFGSVVVAVIGSVLIGIYGQVWAVAASSGPLPSIDNALGLAARRWIGIIGAAILLGLIAIAALIGFVAAIALAGVVAGGLAIILAIALIVPYVWLFARLSMAPWLAADGVSPTMSVSGSWRITKGNVGRILGWSLVYGIVFAIVGGVASLVLGFVPFVGAGIAQAISLGLGYGAGVTLYRRTQAASMPPPAPAAAPQTSAA